MSDRIFYLFYVAFCLIEENIKQDQTVLSFSINKVLESATELLIHLQTWRPMTENTGEISSKQQMKTFRNTVQQSASVTETTADCSVKETVQFCCLRHSLGCFFLVSSRFCFLTILSQLFFFLPLLILSPLFVPWSIFPRLSHESQHRAAEQVSPRLWPERQGGAGLRWHPGLQGDVGQLLLRRQPKVPGGDRWVQRRRSVPGPAHL